ncbi:hypothetical protein IPJ63_00380 [Candidatus Nomurabacteria bacterium]|nr:MAG: hypothetical protein IPJ63_00380 [Candidatus Nomurabacteria bacterium]
MEVVTSEVKKSIRLSIADVLDQKGYLFGNSLGLLESCDKTIDTKMVYILRKTRENNEKFFGIDWNKFFGLEKYLYRTELICSIQLNLWDSKLGGWHINICGESNFEEVKKLTCDIAQALGIETKDFQFTLVSYKTTIRYIENSVVESYFK